MRPNSSAGACSSVCAAVDSDRALDEFAEHLLVDSVERFEVDDARTPSGIPGHGSYRRDYGFNGTSPRQRTAVGDSGTALEWNRARWSTPRTPNGEDLITVSCTSNAFCIALGTADPNIVVEERS